jgi:hypothetical protein
MQGLTGRSPGKSSLRRDVERQFWCEIAKGLTSEYAALAVGRVAGGRKPVVSPTWRHAEFMTVPLSGRYLSFPEREEIAVLKAGGAGRSGDRLAAGPQSVDDLARAAS